MTIEIANRLLKLRKENGLSQEELAEKLGISRQAVSKWERAEASPDTDNLICLAKLYGVSLDELLSSEEKIEDIVEEQVKETEEYAYEQKNEKNKKKTSFSMGNDGIHIIDGNEEVHIDSSGIHITENNNKFTVNSQNFKEMHRKYRHDNGLITVCKAVIPLLIIIAFLILGFTVSWGWNKGWIIFLGIPVLESIFSAITHKRITRFAFPVLVVGIFLVLGYTLPWGWHPGWIVFLTIPVFYSVFAPIDEYYRKKRGDPADEDDDDDDD